LRIEFTPPAQEKGIRLQVVHSSALIHTDPALAERILRNLLANAVRYTQRGRILVGCRSRGNRVRVVVADTGMGIPADKLDAVFEEYVQLGNPERDRTKGLGLGLAIVRRLGVLLGAPIEVQSVAGKGSAFCVTFARGVLADVAAVDPAPAAGDLQGHWVVVVDDEAAIRDAIKHLLTQWGCEVTVAGSGDEAVELVALSPRVPSVILCDYRLRDNEYGLEAIEKLRAEFCEDIPALLVTGDTAPDRIVEIKSSGIAVLHKPLRPEALLQALLQITRLAPG
jgi:CheY-like chemotaxis protein/anti-sigma regulatory factor (Ser/Thr protein kinase)